MNDTTPEPPAKCWCGGDIDISEIRADDEPVAVHFACVESPLHDPTADGRPTELSKIYIAGPMSGYPECNYPLFNHVESLLTARGFEVVNPARVHIDEPHHYVDLIREDLRVMLDCHGVATLDRWWESTGARNEVQVAGILKMPVRTWETWHYLGSTNPTHKKETV